MVQDVASLQVPQKRPRMKPMQAKEQQLQAAQPPPKASSVDTVEEQETGLR